jgi:3-oxoadipate enol-lactonase
MTPGLVLPSSLGTTTEVWDRTLGYWSDAFQLILYNHRGRTSFEQLGRDLLESLGESERVSICGLSLGGATAMFVAASAPERVDRLVLACASARFGEPGPWVERAAVVREHGLEPIADDIVGRWFTPVAPAEVVARFRRMLVDTPRDEYAACCEALARWDFRDRLGEIQAPTLVIAAAEDRATPPEHSELLVHEIPDAKLVVLPDAAHLANVEQAEAFSTLVSEHLAPVEVA